ncbi:MAG: PAS domain S-box protein, partial [Proteobacteria bacterium]|nr:PAS domain S-box protein [Pseudomonadota bacterium]
EETTSAHHAFLRRCFDRVEIAFSKAWVDISDESLTEELQEYGRRVTNEKNFFLTLLESTEQPFVCLDEQLKCTFANSAFVSLVFPSALAEGSYYGIAPEQGVNEACYETIMDEAPWAREMARSFLAGDSQQVALAYTLGNPSGKAYYDIILSRLVDVSGRHGGCVMTMTDVTALRQAYWEVRESEQRVNRILETAPLPLAVTDAESSTIVYLNQRMADLLEIGKKSALGRRAHDFYVHPEDRAELRKQLAATGEVSGFERELKTAKGRHFWGAISGVMTTHEGRLTYIFSVVDMSGQKALLDELRLLSQAVGESPVSVMITDRNGNIEYVNRRFCEVTGYSRQEVLGQCSSILKSGEQGPEIYKELWATISSGKEWTGELSNVNKDGEEYWESVSISPVRDEDGEASHYIALKEDITKRREAILALQDSEERYRRIFDTTADCLIIANMEGFIQEVNLAACEVYGYSREEFVGMNVSQFIHPDSMDVFKDFQQQSKERRFFRGETRDRRKDGTYFNTEVTGSSIRYKGKPHLMAMVRDITDRKAAQETIRENAERFQALIENLPAGVLVFNPDASLALFNTMACVLLGVKSQDMNEKPLDTPLWNFIDLDGKVVPVEQYPVMRILSGEEAIIGQELGVLHPGDRGLVWVQVDAFRENEADGTLKNVVVHFWDITERKLADQGLRESEDFQRLLLRSIGAAIFVIDPANQTLESMNDRARTLLGHGSNLLLGDNINELCWRDADGNCTLGLGHASLGEEQEFVLIRPNGTRVPVSRTTVQVDIKGVSRYVFIVFDITDRKAMERQMNLGQKLEAIGSLAAGIAHEINTPVQYLSSNISFLKGAFEEIRAEIESCPPKICEAGERLKETLEEVPVAIEDCQEGITRVSEIVLGMRRFSHPDSGELKPVDINGAIHNTVTISRNEWKYVAEMELDLAENLSPIKSSPGDCNQVILNVVVNAAQAIAEKVEGTEERGKITITSRQDRDYVEVRIRDTGGGIPEEHQTKIFDPFFTTKEVGKGTGQGLAITHSILDRFSGTIAFETELGTGTTFIIRLPVYHVEPGKE